MSRKSYLESGGQNCPYCDKPAVEGGSMHFDRGMISQEITCTECGKHWFDDYTLTGMDYPNGEKEWTLIGHYEDEGQPCAFEVVAESPYMAARKLALEAEDDYPLCTIIFTLALGEDGLLHNFNDGDTVLYMADVFSDIRESMLDEEEG